MISRTRVACSRFATTRASRRVNAGTAAEVGITLEDVEGILTAVAPIVGTPRTTAAVGNSARALGFAIAAIEDGHPTGALAATADEFRADMVVVGASRGWHRWCGGSVASGLIRLGRWPVIVIP